MKKKTAKTRLYNIPGFPGYFVTKYTSNVYSNRSRWGPVEPHKLKSHPNPKTGYLEVALHKDGKQYTKTIHSLVMLTFVGVCPIGKQCRHLDGNKLNCSIQNLRYGTPKRNNQDKFKHGTHRQGTDISHFVKLSDKKVIRIRRKYRTGKYSMARLADDFRTTVGNIHAIVHYKTWKHLK